MNTRTKTSRDSDVDPHFTEFPNQLCPKSARNISIPSASMNSTELKNVDAIQQGQNQLCANRSEVNVPVRQMSWEDVATDVYRAIMDSGLMDAKHVTVITLVPWTTFVTLYLDNASAEAILTAVSVTNVSPVIGTTRIARDVAAMDTLILATQRPEFALDAETTLRVPLVKSVREASMETL